MLVPITAMATTIWRNRHPGVIVIETEETGMDPEIRLVLFLGAISLMVLFAGLVSMNYELHSLRKKISEKESKIDEEAMQ